MSKIYIVFDDEGQIERLPSGVKFVASGIFSITDEENLPASARIASTEEMATPDDLIKEIENSISDAGDDFQKKFLGARSSNREARFAVNLASAKRLLSDNYADSDSALKSADLQSMTMQSDAQGEGRDAAAFSKWVVEWEAKSVLVAGAIEAFIKKSKQTLPSVPCLIDPAVKSHHLATLKELATQQFIEMTS